MTKPSVDFETLAAAGPWIDTHCHLSLDEGHSADPSTADAAGPVETAGNAGSAASAGAVHTTGNTDSGDKPGGKPDARVEALLGEARAHGVARLVTIATDEASALAAIEIAGAHDDVWASVGLHPHDAVNGTSGLEALLGAPKVVAVGECGLDYHYDHSPRAVQREAFAAQIELARRHDLALVIHTREAWDDTFEILDGEGMPERTIIHCFTGGAPEARKCLDRGAYLSFSGIATFRNAADVREAVALCPTDRLLVETDSPFLAPVPFRGKSNCPGWVPVVGAAVAEVRNVPPAEVAAAVWANAAAVFRLD